MKILSLHVRDFAGIVEADINPGKITIFAGKNKQGKTSLINAIRAALEGADPIEIRKGSARAEILVDLEDITVRRRITPGGNTVEVLNREGFRRPTPQAYLSSLFGTVQFNPVEFIRAAKKAERRKMLLDAVGQTVTAEQIIEACGEVIPGIPAKGPALLMYDLAAKHYYALRHAKNKELLNRRELARTARAKVPEGYEVPVALDEKEKAVAIRADVLNKKIATLQAEKQAAEKAETTRTKIGARIQKNQEILGQAKITLAEEKVPNIAGLRGAVEALRLQLRAAEEALQAGVSIVANIDRLKGDIANMERDIRQDQETLAGLPGVFDERRLIEAEAEADGLDGEAAVLGMEKNLQQVFAEAVATEAARDALQTEADALDGMVVIFRDVLPAKSLSEAKLPVDGLRIDGDDITIDGIPIDNRSGAEKMELALSIVRALAADNPLKLICVDGIEQLDEESFAAFEMQAGKDEFQYFVTRVGTPRAGEIEISEGKVKSA